MTMLYRRVASWIAGKETSQSQSSRCFGSVVTVKLVFSIFWIIVPAASVMGKIKTGRREI